MGLEKLNRYKQNARHGPLQPGSKPIASLFKKIVGKDMPGGSAGRTVCTFVKRRHLYYEKTSLLVPVGSNISDAEKSLRVYIENHPELRDIAGDSSNDELVLSDKEVEAEENELKDEDDSDEYNKKRKMYDLTSSFSDLTMSGKYPDYVPMEAYETLELARKRDPQYAKNLLAFYKFKHEGVFDGMDNKRSVLIVDGKIVAYGESEWDNSSFPKLSEEEMNNSLWRNIVDEPFIIEKKRRVAKIKSIGCRNKQYDLKVCFSLNGLSTTIRACFDTQQQL